MPFACIKSLKKLKRARVECTKAIIKTTGEGDEKAARKAIQQQETSILINH